MAKFYFHLRNGTDEVLDPEGIECSDLAAVRMTALVAARDVIVGDARDGSIDLRYWIDVEDEAGQIVHGLPFEKAVTIMR